MPIYCNNYDINLYQGQSYFLDLDYTDVNDEVVDLNGATFEARMQVRRSPLVEEKLIAIPEPSCEFDCAITYYIKKDGEVCLDIDLDDYEPENLKNLAKLVAIIGTDECYVETLNMLKDGFTAEGRPDLFN